MGGSSSSPARRVTLQEDAAGVVKVSEEVARRLIGHPSAVEAGHKEPAKRHEAAASAGWDSQQRDEELGRMQTFYESRIKALEDKNKDLYQTTTEQFAAAVQEVEQKFLKTTASPICQDLQDAVLKCYQANPKYTLHCSSEVTAFLTCVQRQREKILTRKG